jgi:putative ABC transport system substrate-binding protein
VATLALLAAPGGAPGQRPGPPRRIAVLISDSPCTPTQPALAALLDGLRSLGYRDGDNVAIDCRSAGGRYDRLDALAAELLARHPVVVVAGAAPASLAAKRATSRVPIVSVYTADPVSLGLVSSLARPGANVTGISALAADYVARALQLLTEAAPRTSRVGVVGHAANSTYAIYRRELEPAGGALKVALDFEPVGEPGDLEPALAALHRRGADALFVMHQPLTWEHRERIVAAVARLRLAAMYGSQEAVEAGGLMSYAVSVPDVFRRAASLVDRVLRGAKPADLPVEQPTTFQLAVNLQTARALGLVMPPALLLQASRLIQ